MKVVDKSARTRQGSLAGVLFASVLWIVLLVGAVGSDFCHILAVKNELQNGLDAGALAGAQELWTDSTKCEPIARSIASRNFADGHPIVDGSYGTTVSVTVQKPVMPNVFGKVTLDGTCRIRNLFASLFGRNSDVITAHSAAGTTGVMTTIYADQMFPIAVEASGGKNGPPISTFKVGDIVRLDFNAQKYKNAGWTSLAPTGANANNIWNMVDQALGLKKYVPGTIPSTTIGDSIALNNGQMGARKLTDNPYYDALTDPSAPPLVLPVVTGDPAMNQTETIVGYIAIRPIDIVVGKGNEPVETITGKIERPQVNGGSGQLPTGSQSSSGLIPGPIQLIE